MHTNTTEIAGDLLVEQRDLYVVAGCDKKAVRSLVSASTAFRDYIEQNDLGASQAIGGGVFDTSGKKVASISFNGRVWQLNSSLVVDHRPPLDYHYNEGKNHA